MCICIAGRCCWRFRKYCQSFDRQETRITLHICDYIKLMLVRLLIMASCDYCLAVFRMFLSTLLAGRSNTCFANYLFCRYLHNWVSCLLLYVNDYYQKFLENRKSYNYIFDIFRVTECICLTFVSAWCWYNVLNHIWFVVIFETSGKWQIIIWRYNVGVATVFARSRLLLFECVDLSAQYLCSLIWYKLFILLFVSLSAISLMSK